MKLQPVARFLCVIVVLLGLATPALAQSRSLVITEPGQQHHSKKKWALSAVILVAATFADGFSSSNRIETNPLLRGPNGRYSPARGIAIKSAITGGLLTLQTLMGRSDPSVYEKAAYINFISAGVFAGVAARNHTVPAAE